MWKDEHADGIVARARDMELAGQVVRVVAPHDLIAMKLRADRPQDGYDVSEILPYQMIEDERIRRLVTAEQFAAYARIRRRVQRNSTT